MHSDYQQKPLPFRKVVPANQRVRDLLAPPNRGALILAPAIVVAAAGIGFAGIVLGQLASAFVLATPALLALVVLLTTRSDRLMAAILVVTVIFVDFYQAFGLPLHQPVVGVALALVLLAVLFLAQSEEVPWVSPRLVAFWALLLVLTALAIPRGGQIPQTIEYFVTIFGTGAVMYCVGTQVTRSYANLQLLLTFLMFLAMFIAVHTIIQGLTGRFLFETAAQAEYLVSKGNFDLYTGSTVTRAGSFLENPDWNGVYVAISLFFTAGLIFAKTASRSVRALAAFTCALLLVALLFTFTTASWISAGFGFLIFVAVFLPGRYRWWTLLLSAVGFAAIALLFSKKFHLLLQHAFSGTDVTTRLGAWETALRVIETHPLTGIGMAYTLYLERSAAYRVPLETTLLAQPHNSYLELAAFAGIPVLTAFLLLLFLMFREAWRTYQRTSKQFQPMVGGVITGLIVLSINSLFIDAWTLPPFICIGCLLFGAVTSRGLEGSMGRAEVARREVREVVEENRG
jgi:O-Antigen ligase